jgi:subtilisin family serine protease
MTRGSSFLATLLGSAAAAAVLKPDELLRDYEVSATACEHGHSGVMFSLHASTNTDTWRAALEAAAHPEHAKRNNFHRAHPHTRVVHMHAVHPATLLWAANHEHTRRIEASCVRMHALPQPLPLSGASFLFAGRYYRSDEYSPRPHCDIEIEVASPWSTSSRAVIVMNTTEGNSAMELLGLVDDCDPSGAGSITRRLSAKISMVRMHLGSIVRGNGTHTIKGEYKVDANGREQDTVEWENGEVWTKRPGPQYELDSPIGPIDDRRNGERTRNNKAFVRWNWGPDRIDSKPPVLDDSYKYSNVTGEGTTLYNLDVGVMVSHDDFGRRSKPGYSSGCPTGTERSCLEGWVYKGAITLDVMNTRGCDGHGTHTASTAVGALYGVAPKAEVIAVQVLNCSGSSNDESVVDGIEWAVNHAVHRMPRKPSVISLSLGGDTRSHVLNHAVSRAVDFGITVVVAAGNEGGTNEEDACGGSPSSSSSAITVGATGLAEDDIMEGKLIDINDDPPVPYDIAAPFSSIGSCVDVFAPGVELLAAVPSENSTHVASIMSGTSMAAPMVSGVALQILGQHPHMLPDDVRRAIFCASLQGVIHSLDVHTRNKLLQGGLQLTREPLASLIAAQQELTVEDLDNGVVPTRDATICYRGADVAEQTSLAKPKSKGRAKAQKAKPHPKQDDKGKEHEPKHEQKKPHKTDALLP